MDPASELTLATAEASLVLAFPDLYRAFLSRHDGGSDTRTSLLLYSSSEISERNHIWEVAKYAPGYLAIGDDGGGRIIVIDVLDPMCKVLIVDAGSAAPEMMAPIAQSWSEWEAHNFDLSGLIRMIFDRFQQVLLRVNASMI